MHPSVTRHVVTFVLAAVALSPLSACGAEKRIKDCAAHCENEHNECERRHEKDCEGKAKHCAEECRR